MERNRPRILSTNTRMEGGAFVYSLPIRGWSLGAKVNGLRRLQAESQVELPPTLRSRGAAREALLPPPTGMISHKGTMSVSDRAFKGEL